MMNQMKWTGREQLLDVRLLTEAELANELRVERVYLWRRRNEGMPYYRLGTRTIRYSLSDVMEWLEERKTYPRASQGMEVRS